MRSAARSSVPASPPPLALVRDTAPPITAAATARHWRRLVGRRRGANVSTLLLYGAALFTVGVLVDAAGARLLPATCQGEP